MFQVMSHLGPMKKNLNYGKMHGNNLSGLFSDFFENDKNEGKCQLTWTACSHKVRFKIFFCIENGPQFATLMFHAKSSKSEE
jgi:hypothetical protein